MANIIGRLTNNEVEVLQVDAVPSAGAGTSAPIGAIAAYNSGSTGTAYLKTGALDTAWDLINTAAVAGGVLTGVAGRLPVYPSSGNQVDDEYIQNANSIVVSHVAQAGRAVAIVYSIPNPGNSVSAADFVLTEGGQIINGPKTFGNDMTINGNLTVNGTMTTINSTVTEISDPTITLNNGGAAASGGGAGIEVEENAVITAFATVAAARNGWSFKAPTNANTATILLTSLTSNRSYTLPDVSDTFAMGSGAAGRVSYWTSSSQIGSNANFFWDNTNTRLGIGNGAPSDTLHVTGTARISSLNSAAPVRSSATGVLSNGTIVLTAASDVSGVLPIANGGTNSGTTLNNNRIIVSSGGAIVEAAALTNGQLLIGSTGAAPVAANITQGAFNSVIVSNGAGSITLDTVQDIRISASPTFVNATLSGKTAGSIIFAGTSGVLSESNAQLFWDNTNSRLGVGTNTPVAGRKIDVNGASIFRGSVRYADAGASNANWEMFQAQVNTTDATATTLQSITVPTDSTMVVIAKIVGRRTGGASGSNGDSATYIRTARFKNIGGTVTINGLQTDYTNEDQLGWNGTMDVSGTSARIRVTGAANNNITWTVTYEIITLS
jgi:hypothetical protein